MITENLSTLKIHKLTQEQYDRELAAGNIDETALYLTPDSGIHIASKTGESPVLNDSVAGGLKIDRICGRSKQETGIITDDKGNEIVIPNPEYPQPIVSAGQKLVDGVVTDVGITKKLTGKNLLKNTATSQTKNGVTFTVNENGTVTADGTATADIFVKVGGMSQLPKGEYIVSGCPSGGSTSSYFATLYKVVDGTNKTVASLIGNNVSFTTDEPIEILYIIRIANGAKVSNIIYEPMLVEGTEPADYEPYTEQTLTLNHVLRGIPLGTDIPEMFKSNALHMDGIYWDEKEQQYYIADTIDAERGVLVQNIGHYKLNSSLTIALSSKHIGCIYFDASSIGGKIKAPYICTHAKWCGIYPTALAYGVGISNEFSYNLWLFESSKTVAEAKAYFDTNDVFMDYILATPIETPLTDEEIIALHQLKTYQGVTHIFGSNDPDATMILKYSSSEIGGVTLENSNLHAVNEVLRRRMLTHSDVVDNLASTDADVPLSANQGRVLKDELDDLKDEIPDVLPINKGGTGGTDADTALANLGGVKASETIKTAFYDDAAENIGQLLDAKCAHARELNAPAVCIYGGWQNIDFGVFYAQVVNNVVQGIYVKGDTAYIVRCDSGTDTATYLEVAVQSDIDAIGAGTEITDVTQITQGGMYHSNGNVANAPTNDGVYYEYFASKNGWIVSIIARSGSDGATYVSNNGYDGTTWTNKGWHRLITDEDIPYKVVIDDTAGTIDFIDR